LKTLLSRYRVRNALVAGGLAIIGALLVAAYVTSYRNNVTRGADLVPVYVAVHDIAAGTDGASAVGGGALKRETELRRNVVPGAITNARQIAGLAAAQTIYAGQQITIREFHPLIQQGPLASIDGNLRAIAIPGNNQQLLAGIVKAGDHVDVLANVKYSVRGANRTVTRVILQNLLVLYAPSSGSSGGTFAGNTGATTNSITFAVTDEQAAKLFYATQNTNWSLVLRPVAKPTDSPQIIQTIQNLVGDGLSQQKVSQLTGGQGLGSVSNAGQ
jgi:Flp pilus assembly protein CpaB